MLSLLMFCSVLIAIHYNRNVKVIHSNPCFNQSNISQLEKSAKKIGWKNQPENQPENRQEKSAGEISRKNQPEISARKISRKNQPEKTAGKIGRKNRPEYSARIFGRKNWPEKIGQKNLPKKETERN